MTDENDSDGVESTGEGASNPLADVDAALRRARKVLGENEEEIPSYEQIGKKFDRETVKQIQEFTIAAEGATEVRRALVDNPVSIPDIDVKLVDPDLLDLMVTDFETGPMTEPTVKDSFDFEPENTDATSITPEEWIKMGIESDMIIRCDECSSGVLRQNSHRYQRKEDGKLVCPVCGTTGRGFH